MKKCKKHAHNSKFPLLSNPPVRGSTKIDASGIYSRGCGGGGRGVDFGKGGSDDFDRGFRGVFGDFSNIVVFHIFRIYLYMGVGVGGGGRGYPPGGGKK